MKNADMPAMPMFDGEANPCRVRNPDTGEIARAAGLTKREMMAMHMMAGLNSNPTVNMSEHDMAELAVICADALLSTLEEQQ
ncbi:MAG: hypothetical protein ACRCXB_08080 [Aeromonadaceae bacterium]